MDQRDGISPPRCPMQHPYWSIPTSTQGWKTSCSKEPNADCALFARENLAASAHQIQDLDREGEGACSGCARHTHRPGEPGDRHTWGRLLAFLNMSRHASRWQASRRCRALFEYQEEIGRTRECSNVTMTSLTGSDILAKEGTFPHPGR